MAKRAAEIKNKREAMRLLRNVTGESSKASDHMSNAQQHHNDFLKAIIEQQKLVQQQELEHKQKLQQEQQEQERKRQEMAYYKQLEMKKRQDEKMLILEQRKAEKNAQREKKIVSDFLHGHLRKLSSECLQQEKYMEIVMAKEMKRVAEDLQLRDLKVMHRSVPLNAIHRSPSPFSHFQL